jgi:hypothetical protein
LRHMARSRLQLRVCGLSGVLENHPIRAILFLNLRLYRSFFGALVNQAALILMVAILGLRWGILHQTSQALCWVLLQLLAMPFLMSAEEYLHALVFVYKGLPWDHLDLVSFYRVGRKGRRWICYGGAIRYQGHLSPRDRIHISAPGPLFSSHLGLAIWAAACFLDGSLLVGPAQIHSWPIVLYLLSSLWPVRGTLPTDMANILRAKSEGQYSLVQTVGFCLDSCRLVWRSLAQMSRRP